jgi:hypothetical protein
LPFGGLEFPGLALAASLPYVYWTTIGRVADRSRRLRTCHRTFKREADGSTVVAGESTPRFAIPDPPSRRYPRRGGVEYEGQTVFVLDPDAEVPDERLVDLLESVFSTEAYRYGDWFDLPMPLYVVHDDGTCDTFRVAVRDGTVEFHVIPGTTASGLRRLFERLRAASGVAWTVERRSAAEQ